MTIFLILNVIGVAFLFYVLVNFWVEGRHMKNGALPAYRLSSRYGSIHQVYVAMKPVELATQQPDRTSVVQFPVVKSRTNVGRIGSDQSEVQAPLRKYSTR